VDLGSQPLVSIVTPVYNNAEHIGECIESVLAQTYQNWDYTIVNNCSTDGSGDVARRYAAKDSRIRVLDNQRFLRSVANHNHAFRQISPDSKYCKMVFADDWIFARCIEEMVAVGEEHPSVGFVGSYGIWEVVKSEGPYEHSVAWGGLPYPSKLVPGRELCRRMFMEGLYVFGTATSLLYRSDVVRKYDPFYNESNFHADKEVCAVLLKTCDFGFVHQILTFTRGRAESLNQMSVRMHMDIGCALHTLKAHGPDFLTQTELQTLLDRHVAQYYNFLAVSLMRGRFDRKFWDFHKRKLTEEVGFSRARLVWAMLSRIWQMALNPYETFKKLRGEKSKLKPPADADKASIGAEFTDHHSIGRPPLPSAGLDS
jgi:glycosyltransferase involved in cell wall biosynthesis